jgi:Tol biopolymer transport system component
VALGGGGRQALLNIVGDVYVRDIERGTRRLLSSAASFPIWSPDARWATYATTVGGKQAIVRKPVDGSAPPETLITSDERLVPTSWNARTGELAYFDEASDVWILKPGGAATRLLSSAFNERSGSFSPDGRWLAYVSDETGAYQVYVVPYPGPGPKLEVSIDGGMSP